MSINVTKLPDGIYRVTRADGNLIIAIQAGRCVIWNEA